MADYSFITDRLAVGDVASRAVPGFVAVVSLLATAPYDELYKAPVVPSQITISRTRGHSADMGWSTVVLHIDINDGEGPGQTIGDGRDLAVYLDEATSFIAGHIRNGCVLVHCGAGKSRSVSVVVAYLCRYAGMSLSEALALVKERRPGACPADCFVDAIKRWLELDKLAQRGPRQQAA